MSQTTTATATGGTRSQQSHAAARIMLTPRKTQQQQQQPAHERKNNEKQAIWSWTFAAAAVAPAFVRDVHAMRADHTGDARNAFFWLGTVPCRTVTVVGLVVETWLRDNAFGFTVDDGTGVIECMHKYGSHDMPPMPEVGDTLRTTGKVYIRKRKDQESRQLDVERGGFAAQYVSAEPEHALNVAKLHRTRYREPFVLEKQELSATPRATRVNRTQASQPSTPTRSYRPQPVASSSKHPNPAPPPVVSPSKRLADHSRPSSPSKAAPSLTHPANLRTKQRTRNTFRIYLKHYMSADRGLILQGEGAVFGWPKEKETSGTATQSFRMGDDSVLTSVPSQMPDMSFAMSTQRTIFSSPNKRRRLLPEDNDEQTSRGTQARWTQATDAASFSTATLPLPAADEHVGFTRVFLEQVPELASLATSVARVERHMRDKPPAKVAAATKSSAAASSKAPDRPRTRDEKESADAAAGRDVLRWGLRTLVDEGALVSHEGSVFAWRDSAVAIDDSGELEGYIPVTASLLTGDLRRVLRRSAVGGTGDGGGGDQDVEAFGRPVEEGSGARLASSSPSPQVQLFRELTTAFEVNDIVALNATLADDLVWTMLPKSLELPQRDKTEFLDFFRDFRGQFATFQFPANLTAEQPGRVVHFTEPSGTTIDGREYHNQIINTVDIEFFNGQPKIVAMQEFVDSLYTSQWLAGS
ncbi:hypothetical protein BKA62DRAFT_828453 [Auriculariales sp. MPI-PUGE-AT-0066]|nr:hypothetical protein BKA62DRAFT_828453 [Auriculariales sp. MPI-PUGE-AT-0066]